MGKIARRAFVVGIDALTWSLYEKLRSQGYFAGIEKLLSRGAIKGSVKCVPPYTPPIWTSIASGVNPGKHGVIGFFDVDRLGRPTRLNTALDVKVPRLHDIVSYEGGSSLVGGLPFTVKPVIPFRGAVIPDRFMPEAPAAPDWVERVYRARLKEAEEALGGGDEEEVCGIAAFDKALAETVYDILGEMEKEFNLVFLVFSIIDGFMHNMPEIASQVNRSRCVKEALESIDRLIDFIVERYGDEDLVVILSDHGIAPTNLAVAVNKILYDEGLLSVEWRGLEADFPGPSRDRGRLLRLLRLLPAAYNVLVRIPGLRGILYRLGRALAVRSRSLAEVSRGALRPRPDPESSLAYMTDSTYGGIYVNESAAGEVDAIVDKVIEVLASFNERLGVKVFDYIGRGRGGAIWGPYAHKAPHVLVVPSEGYTLAGSITDDYIVPSTMKGYHTITNMHVISLPDLSSHLYDAARMVGDPWDYANLVLAYLGVPLPQYADGKLAQLLKGRVGAKDHRMKYTLARRLVRGITSRRGDTKT